MIKTQMYTYLKLLGRYLIKKTKKVLYYQWEKPTNIPYFHYAKE